MKFSPIRIPSLKAGVTRLEDGIITLSGPLLAVSGIIAGVDLVTGGNILRTVGWLATVWAVTLLLTLDFQVLALGARAHQIYRSTKGGWRKACEIALAVLIAAAISYVSIQMQSIIARSNSESISIDQATAELGINAIALIWERSTLVLVLIFMSGWFRDEEIPPVEIPAPMPVPPLGIGAPDLEQVLERLDARYQQHFEAVIQQVRITMEQTAIARPLPAQQQIGFLPPHDTSWEQHGTDLSPTADEPGEQQEPPGGVHPATDPPQKRVHGERVEDFGDVIEAIYQQHPEASMSEVARMAGCSKATVSKWKKRLQPGGDQDEPTNEPQEVDT